MHPHECNHCGYDLAGLGLGGTCPECGNRFDKTYTYSRAGRRQHPLAKHAKPIALFGLALAILCVGGLISLLADKKLTVVVTAVLFAAVPAIGALVGIWSDHVDRRNP